MKKFMYEFHKTIPKLFPQIPEKGKIGILEEKYIFYVKWDIFDFRRGSY